MIFPSHVMSSDFPLTVHKLRLRNLLLPSSQPILLLLLYSRTGPRRALISLKLSDTRVYEPEIRTRLGRNREPIRCRANMAAVRQSRPDSGPSFEVKKTQPVPSLGSEAGASYLQGYLAHKKKHSPQGPPKNPRHSPTLGF